MVFSSSYEGHYARDLAHGFHDSGIQIGFISLTNSSVPNWVETFLANDFSSQFGGGIKLGKKIFRTIKAVRDFKPDIIQTHLFRGGIVGLFAGKLLGIPVIHTRHHIDEHYQSGTFVHRLIDRLVAKSADHVVVCSEAAKKWLVEVERVKESHISVINQGFDFSHLNPTLESTSKAKSSLGFSEENLNLICVARYSKAKGQDYLLKAFSQLLQTNHNITLTFMGPGDSRWLFDLVEELNLSRYVNILNSRNDIPACIAASDVVIHPSLADSFSQLVIEVQAVGGVLIATNIAAAQEQIIDGVTGLIIPPRDSNAIAEAVIRLLNDPDLASSIRTNGPIHVREKFTWQRMISEEISCLESHLK